MCAGMLWSGQGSRAHSASARQPSVGVRGTNVGPVAPPGWAEPGGGRSSRVHRRPGLAGHRDTRRSPSAERRDPLSSQLTPVRRESCAYLAEDHHCGQTPSPGEAGGVGRWAEPGGVGGGGGWAVGHWAVSQAGRGSPHWLAVGHTGTDASPQAVRPSPSSCDGSLRAAPHIAAVSDGFLGRPPWPHPDVVPLTARPQSGAT